MANFKTINDKKNYIRFQDESNYKINCFDEELNKHNPSKNNLKNKENTKNIFAK